MGKSHRIAEDYAVADLPPEIRRAIQEAGSVRIEIAPDDDRSFWKLRGVAARRGIGIDDAVARVRALRDEWD